MTLQLLLIVLVASIGVEVLGYDVTCADRCACDSSTLNSERATLPYRPVILLHDGVGASVDLYKLRDRIQEMHPGTQVFNMNCSTRVSSLAPLWDQVDKIARQVLAIGAQYPDGMNFIGHSQGGLIARAILQKNPSHNVRNLISLSAPQAGLCGAPLITCKNGHTSLYTNLGQLNSVGNIWNDPRHQDEYRKRNVFLPIINNEVVSSMSSDFKAGITKLGQLILAGSPADKMLKPWQSSQFGFWNNNGDTIEDLRSRTIYTTDAIGLRTLDEAKKLIIYTVPNVQHLEWLYNKDVIDQYIIPHLD